LKQIVLNVFHLTISFSEQDIVKYAIHEAWFAEVGQVIVVIKSCKLFEAEKPCWICHRIILTLING